MLPKHIITQVVGVALALGAICWAVAEHRRYGRHHRDRLPLTNPFALRSLAPLLGSVALFTLGFHFITAFELVPKPAPLLFAAMLGWGLTIVLGSAIALYARFDWFAVGWLMMLDERTLRVEVQGAVDDIPLREGSVQAYYTTKGPQWLRFDISNGDRTLHIMAMLPFRSVRLDQKGGVVKPLGLTIAISGEHFCQWVAPYVAIPLWRVRRWCVLDRKTMPKRFDNVRITNVVDGTTIEGHEAVEAYFEREKKLFEEHGSTITFQLYRANLAGSTRAEVQGERLAELRIEGDEISGTNTVAAVKKRILSRLLGDQAVASHVTFVFAGRVMRDKALFYADHFMHLPSWVQVVLSEVPFPEVIAALKRLPA